MTPEKAREIYAQGEDAVVAILCGMASAIERLEARVKVLEERLAQNSRNSSIPSSQEGVNKPKPRPKSLRKKSGRKPGGQKGHEGKTLEPPENADDTVVYHVGSCEKCDRSLKRQPVVRLEKRYVFDLVDGKLHVTVHMAEVRICPGCDHENKGRFPEVVNAPRQYGPNIQAIAVYMKTYQLVPYDRLAELFRDVFFVPISEGTLTNIVERCSMSLEEATERIREHLQNEAVLHFDETGISVNGKRIWLHVVCTPKYTFYQIHDKRGCDAIDDIGILPAFEGRAIHDFWRAYLKYGCEHGLCNAHHLRELIFLFEVQEQAWAEKMLNCLLDIKEAVDDAKAKDKAALSKKQRHEFEASYKHIVKKGFRENPLPKKTAGKRGRQKLSKAQNLLIRIRDYQKEVLAFMYDFRVPFDNNQAERDIRMVKGQQKISGTFRSEDGGKHFCRIRGYISTIKKNGLNVLDAIRNIFTGKASAILLE